MTQKEETKNIGAPSGWRKAPAGLLLLIAEALASNRFWWLMSPERRKEEGFHWGGDAPNDLEIVQYIYNDVLDGEDGEFAPNILFDSVKMRWNDFKHGRWVSVSVSDDAEIGVIKWNSGTGEASSLLASILCLLPDWADDRVVAARIAAIDRKEAIRIIENDLPLCHFGGDYRPRRSWDLQGVEIRYANWLDGEGIKALIEKLRGEGYMKVDPPPPSSSDVEVVHRNRR